MKKQILSLLIAIMLLIGMIPFSASASDTIINEIVFELEEAPAPGGALDFPSIVSVNGSADKINLVSIDVNDWYFSDEYSLISPEMQLYQQDTFQNGYAYDLYIGVVPENGYQFASDCTFTLKLPDYVTEKGYLYSQTSNFMGVDFYFNMTGVKPEISSIQMELEHAPEVGGDPAALIPTVIAVDANSGYTHLIEVFNSSWYWYNPEDHLYYLEDGTFREDREYQLNLDIFAAGDYVFNEDVTFSVCVNGETRNGYVGEVWTPWNYLFCLDFSTLQNTPISSITLATDYLPMAGNTPFDFSVYSVNGDPREVAAVEFTNGWGIYDETEGLYLPNGLTPFAAGEKYAATIFLTPAEGYAFTDDCEVTVLEPDGNLTFVCEYVDAGEITGIVPFATLSELISIDSITLETNSAPAAGATPFSFTVRNVNGEPLTDAIVASTGWGLYDEQEEVYLPNGLLPFAAGEKYAATIYLEPAEGYALSPTCDINVLFPNGNMEFSTEYINAAEAYVFIHYPTIPAAQNNFTDVKEADFFRQPVEWAVSRNITNGTGPTTFGPNEKCIRAQVATFLWRAAGCPEPQSTNNPFTDVKPADYFYKAVLWAVEEGITNGTGPTTFSPYEPCTRGQIVTFLWRAAGAPEADAYTPFVDVDRNAYYYSAIVWALRNEITNGIDGTHFGPNATCTRAQTVTFIYRMYN